MGSPQWHVDAHAVMQLKSLAMRARAIVEGFQTGLHRSPVHGFSVEFSEYRPYALGDDPRAIDWKLLGRTDRSYVKKYEDETNRRCYLVVDQSYSMNFGSGPFSKADYARTLAATLAYFLHQQRDAVGLMTCGLEDQTFIPPKRRPGHLHHLMDGLSKPSQGEVADFGIQLEHFAGLTKRRGLVIILSDFLLAPASLKRPLGYLLGRGHEIAMLRILDPAELTLEIPSDNIFIDPETGQKMVVDPESARKEYLQNFVQHQTELIDTCHACSVRLSSQRTDTPIPNAMLDWLRGLTPISYPIASER